MIKADFGKVLTALITASILFAAGAIWDFQNVKGKVNANEKAIDLIGDKIDIVAKVICKKAILDKLPDAAETCHDILKKNGR